MWFGALLGPIAVPMLLGLLSPFKKCGPTAAIFSIGAGFLAFIITKNTEMNSLALEVSLPLITSFVTYILIGLLNYRKPVPDKVEKFMNLLLGPR